MKNLNNKNIEKILDHLFSGENGADAEMKEVIRGYLESTRDEEATVEGLSGFFNRYLDRKPNRNSRYVRESLRRIQRELNFRTVTPIPLARRRSFRVAVVGIAAAAVVAVALLIPGLFPTHTDPTAPAMVAVSTAPHEIREVTLPDGSTARLKAGTNITFSEGFDEGRTISIDGEAFFTVKHDTEHPFMVKAENMTVTVTGTEFNVKAWSEAETSEVMLASGSVEVRSGESTEVLAPSEIATIDHATDRIEVATVEQADILRVRGINLSFDDVTLDEALTMIADFYGVRIDAADVPAVSGIVVSMEDGATLEQTLDMLQQINPVFDYSVEGDRVTIRRK